MSGKTETNEGLHTEKKKRNCPHCKEWHEVEKVVEPGYERVVLCPRTGEVA